MSELISPKREMDSFLELIGLVISLIMFLFFFYVVFCSKNKSKNSSNTSTAREPQEVAGGWPIIGHLHLLGGGDTPLYRILGAMADKWGPAFNIRLGTRRAFVVSNWQVAKECLAADKSLASRPNTAAVKNMCYNGAVFSFAPYSPFWREMRKISVLEFFSNSQIDMLKHVCSSEVDSLIKELYGQWARNGKNQPMLVELNKWLEHMTLNIVTRMVAGKCYSYSGADADEAASCKKAIGDFFRLLGTFVVSDAIPFLWWLDLQGHEKQMKKTAKYLDLVLGEWLQEHRVQRKSGTVEEKDDKDFIDVMLSLEEKGLLQNFQYDSNTIIKSNCLTMLIGGGDAVPGTLIWAVSLLLNHPNVLKKVQQELDRHIGMHREVHESDIKNLVYLQAMIKETFRLYPAAPLSGPREAIEDCTVGGYNIKAGTRLIMNIWKIQRDPTVWADPYEFRPERFLDPVHEHVHLRGQQFVLMPFGIGRRSCPGADFTLQVLHFTVARLVHAFDLSKPGDEPVDMTERASHTMPKAKPLKVLLNPRLSSKLYG